MNITDDELGVSAGRMAEDIERAITTLARVDVALTEGQLLALREAKALLVEAATRLQRPDDNLTDRMRAQVVDFCAADVAEAREVDSLFSGLLALGVAS